MNEQNLKPNTERTPSERIELARKAGIASGVRRRENAAMRELVQAALEMVDEETDQTNKERAAAALVNEAIHGNIKALEMVCKFIGETPDGSSPMGKRIEIEIVGSRKSEEEPED